MATDTPVTAYRGERILAFMVASAVLLSIVCFVAVIIATASGVTDFSTPPWPTIIILPSVGLPVAVILVIALVVTSGIRRGRETRDAAK